MSKICSICEENFAQLSLASSIFCQKSWNSTHMFVSLSWIHILSFVLIFQFLSKIWAFFAQNWVLTEGLPFQNESSMWCCTLARSYLYPLTIIVYQARDVPYTSNEQKMRKSEHWFYKILNNFNFHLVLPSVMA